MVWQCRQHEITFGRTAAGLDGDLLLGTFLTLQSYS